MRWEVSEWRGPDIEDGAAIHNAQQQQQWRISLKNSKGRRGRERLWRRRKLCNCQPVVTNPNNNICEGGGRHHCNSSHPRWSPIQTTTSVRGVDAIIAILLIPERRCSCSAKRRPWPQYGGTRGRRRSRGSKEGRNRSFWTIGFKSESTFTFLCQNFLQFL